MQDRGIPCPFLILSIFCLHCERWISSSLQFSRCAAGFDKMNGTAAARPSDSLQKETPVICTQAVCVVAVRAGNGYISEQLWRC